jgi:hypothetical protein
MANYKELEGFGVQTLATDPDSAGWVGSIFYNSTEGVFKTVKPGGIAVGTWASGGNLNTARGNGIGGGGTQTNALAFGGDPRTGATENYNGTSWTEVNDLNSARNYLTGIGESGEACMANSGDLGAPGYTGATEIWNGTSWTEVADTSPARGYVNLAGSTTSAIQTGGFDPSYPSGNSPYAQEWDGSSWTEVTEMNTPRYAAAGFGANAEASIIAGGSNTGGPGNASTELWNGSSWTELNDLNSARYNFKGFGISTQGVVAGGAGPTSEDGTGKTEFWNGTSWTEVNDLATARRGLGSGTGSPSSAGIVFGGNTPPVFGNVANTEEWTAPDVVINTLTTS